LPPGIFQSARKRSLGCARGMVFYPTWLAFSSQLVNRLRILKSKKKRTHSAIKLGPNPSFFGGKNLRLPAIKAFCRKGKASRP
jgi:hypothetical protein